MNNGMRIQDLVEHAREEGYTHFESVAELITVDEFEKGNCTGAEYNERYILQADGTIREIINGALIPTESKFIKVSTFAPKEIAFIWRNLYSTLTTSQIEQTLSQSGFTWERWRQFNEYMKNPPA